MELFEKKNRKKHFEEKEKLLISKKCVKFTLPERFSLALPSSSFFHFWTSGFVFESSIFFVLKVFFYRSRIILARPVTTLCAKLRKEKTVETVRAIVGPVSLFVGTESASTLRIARFADNTAGTLHRRICLPL